jgi:hypothetical protein
MKKLIASFVALGLAGSVAFALLQPWNFKKRPPISLPEAYALATQALGAATNEFYCVLARTQVSRSRDGEWAFMFANTNNAEKNVFVFLDGRRKPEVINGGVDY